ncbi:dTMP kinase [Candidatus Woesearchaeota archaeon]|nr:dTMP kinase [Candidatus Woesearchaeota archaeon]
MRYNFISFEGIDGTGKSTIVEKIAREIINVGGKPYLTRDPVRDVEPWKSLYSIFEKSEKIDKLSEALLLLSSRIDNSRKRLEPALARGETIVADRFHDSWFAYQSIRLSDNFGDERKALDYLVSQHQSLVDQDILLEPDRTVLLRVNPETSMKRVNERTTKITKSKYDVLEFQKKVSNQYDIIANMFKDRIVVIDTGNKNLERVSEEVMSVLGFAQH